jgi:hypothetical protein
MLQRLPAAAAWRHLGSREGFETTFFARDGTDILLEGHTAAVEDGQAWAVRYALVVDERWSSRHATIVGQAAPERCEVTLVSVGAGRWHVDGEHRPELDGCVDVDLESSACTNTLPVHRLHLDVGARGVSSAVYVRAPDLSVMRLDQEYRRLQDDRGTQRYWYQAETFDYEGELAFDAAGLTLDYPGLAHRVY